MSASKTKEPLGAFEADLTSEREQHRFAMIAEAAYFKALERGFVGGADCAIEDWLQTEAAIDAQLAAKAIAAPSAGVAVPNAEPR